MASAGLTDLVSRYARAAAEADTFDGTLPFVGEGNFPLGRTVGAGLARRRALDLSTLTADTLVTTPDEFFIRTGCPDTLPSPAKWSIKVHGLLESPIELDLEWIKAEAADQGPHLVECAGNSRNAHFGFISVARWTGVPMARVLERVRVKPQATQVLVSGFDEHTVLDPGSVPGASWIFGLDRLRDASAFLATGMNGAPLTPDHGAPVRLVVPGWYGCAAIKWVNEIALVGDDEPATSQMQEYAGRTLQDPAGPRDRQLMASGRRPQGPALAKDWKPATIDPAALAVRVERRRAAGGAVAYRVVGIAWGGRDPLRALSIRFHPQTAFAPVESLASGDGKTWSLWTHTFRPPAPGRYRIDLAVENAGRTRRLDAGYYSREIEIRG
jgi:DMSO/TMAO reductase YedYZ molybdopterin-dependent catalytic subunit